MRLMRIFSLLLVCCLLLAGCAPAAQPDQSPESSASGSALSGDGGPTVSVAEPSAASEPEPVPPYDRSALYSALRDSRRLLYGLGEPLYADLKRNFDMEQIYDWIEALGVQSFRLWTPLTTCLSSATRLDLLAVQRFREMTGALQDRGAVSYTHLTLPTKLEG